MRRKVTKLVQSEDAIKARQMMQLLDDYTHELEQTNAEIEAVMGKLLKGKLTPKQQATLNEEVKNFLVDCDECEKKLRRNR